MNPPKNDSKYIWTAHAWMKMQYYGISEQRVKRIVRFPKRVEEGVLEGAVAAMQPAGTKGDQEMWVMYVLTDARKKNLDTESDTLDEENKKEKKLDNMAEFFKGVAGKRFKIITAWRYPGKSPERDPIPSEILSEIRGLL